MERERKQVGEANIGAQTVIVRIKKCLLAAIMSDLINLHGIATGMFHRGRIL